MSISFSNLSCSVKWIWNTPWRIQKWGQRDEKREDPDTGDHHQNSFFCSVNYNYEGQGLFIKTDLY